MKTKLTIEHAPATATAVSARPHGGLLLNRLESRIIADTLTVQDRTALKSRSLWENLERRERSRWADVALMAGETETALVVLNSLVREDPADDTGWRRLVELLAVLGRGPDLAKALSAARRHLGDDFGRDLSFLTPAAAPHPPDHDMDSAAAPFESRRRRQDRVSRFLALFNGREDCFARQWTNREESRQGYVPINASLGPADIEEHLSGKKTYGIYLLRPDGTVRVAVIDADLRPDFRKPGLSAEQRHQIRRESTWLASRIRELSALRGARPLVEVSGGKGYHFWYFFDPPAPATDTRQALGSICNAVRGDLEVFTIEVFPKQDRLTGKGFGNLVKLPLGVHRLTGKRSYFPECQNRATEAQLAALEKVTPVAPDEFIANADAPTAEVLIHPRLAPWAETYPPLHRLQTRCPPISQIMALCMDRGTIAMKEEKILYQTIGFLDQGREYLHHLLSRSADYNPHMVDYRLSRLRGTPLGCRRIHSLLGFNGPFCRFARPSSGYLTPLLHVDDWQSSVPAGERAEDLKSALSALRTAIGQVEGFLER